MQKLIELRKATNIKAIKLANLLSISVQSYYKYETGESQPDITKLIILADFYNVTLDYLCGHKTQSGLFSNLNEQQLKIIEILENFSNEQVDAVLNLNKLNYKNFAQIANNIQFLLSEQEKPQ